MKNKNKYIFFAIAGTFLLSAVFFLAGPKMLAHAQEGWNPDSLTIFGLSDRPISMIIEAILYWILGIFSSIAIIAFAISGVQYLLSAGNESMIETAKRHMVWSIVGVIVGLSGLVIIYAIDEALLAGSNF
jgi:hypothetical protein